MNRINRDNYEAYLLDFSEGNLSDELQVELELFLIQHPDLSIDLSDLSLVSIDAESLSFNEKQTLKKSESDLISEAQFIAYIENQLPVKEKIELEKSCTNNESLAKELNLYKHTLLTADATIIFPDKGTLKRETKIIWFNFSSTQYSIAASVLLLLGMYFFWPTSYLTGVSVDSLAFDLKAKTNLENKINAIALLKDNNKPIVKEKQNQSLAPDLLKPKVNVQVANNVPQQTEEMHSNPVTNIIPNNAIVKTSAQIVNEENGINSKPNTVVDVITENDDELVANTLDKKKKGFWAFAERTLKNLNTVGVKAVNGEEENTANNTAYALTLGKINITHKSN